MPFEMNIYWAVVLLPSGLLILWKAAEVLVTGAVSLAEQFGVSPLIIGLTVVAMGTSSPEVAASIAAAVHDAGDVAIGNVYGSNIANLALIGGICALIRPIKIQLRTLRHQMPVMLVVALLLWPVMFNGYLSRPEGTMLLAIFVGLLLLTVYVELRTVKSGTNLTGQCGNHVGKNSQTKRKSIRGNIIFVIIGLAGLALGADLTVRGAVFAGQFVGLSEAVIGMSIVAIGTSLPELATCVVAALKGHSDISIGNLVGSNIFNTLLVVGAAGTIGPFSVVRRLTGADYWIMIAVSAGFVLMAMAGRRVSRINGVFLLGGYASYIVYLLAFTRGL